MGNLEDAATAAYRHSVTPAKPGERFPRNGGVLITPVLATVAREICGGELDKLHEWLRTRHIDYTSWRIMLTYTTVLVTHFRWDTEGHEFFALWKASPHNSLTVEMNGIEINSLADIGKHWGRTIDDLPPLEGKNIQHYEVDAWQYTSLCGWITKTLGIDPSKLDIRQVTNKQSQREYRFHHNGKQFDASLGETGWADFTSRYERYAMNGYEIKKQSDVEYWWSMTRKPGVPWREQ